MSSDSDENSPSDQPGENPIPPASGGIFIIRGMQIGIPPGGFTLKISEEGKLEAAVSLQVGLDMSPYWLRIAFEHLIAAELHNKDVYSALAISHDEQLGQALEKEFSAGMQAAMASAIAIDAFYALVKERIDIPQQMLDAWKKNRTARQNQIFEVLKRAFVMRPASHKLVREIVNNAAILRDAAVHPPSKLDGPIWHPELQKHTEWRFVTYRFQSVMPMVRAALSMVAQLALKPKKQYPRLKGYCGGLDQAVSPLVEEWEQRYGLLYPRDGKTSG